MKEKLKDMLEWHIDAQIIILFLHLQLVRALIEFGVTSTRLSLKLFGVIIRGYERR